MLFPATGEAERRRRSDERLEMAGKIVVQLLAILFLMHVPTGTNKASGTTAGTGQQADQGMSRLVHGGKGEPKVTKIELDPLEMAKVQRTITGEPLLLSEKILRHRKGTYAAFNSFLHILKIIFVLALLRALVPIND